MSCELQKHHQNSTRRHPRETRAKFWAVRHGGPVQGGNRRVQHPNDNTQTTTPKRQQTNTNTTQLENLLAKNGLAQIGLAKWADQKWIGLAKKGLAKIGLAKVGLPFRGPPPRFQGPFSFRQLFIEIKLVVGLGMHVGKRV